VLFIDLPSNPLKVKAVSDGGGHENAVSDGGHFLYQINFDGTRGINALLLVFILSNVAQTGLK